MGLKQLAINLYKNGRIPISMLSLPGNEYMPLKSVMKYGAALLGLGLFFSEWKVVTRFLPGYSSKYETMDYQYLRDADAQVELDKLAAIEKAEEKKVLMEEIKAMLAGEE